MSFKTYRFAPEIVILCLQDWVYGNEGFANVVACPKKGQTLDHFFILNRFPLELDKNVKPIAKDTPF